jgi:hypothetical protein
MNLSDYIRQHGDDHCAALWDVKPRTAAAYRRREIFPSQQVAQRIVETTRGAVSYEGIYGQTQEAA